MEPRFTSLLMDIKFISIDLLYDKISATWKKWSEKKLEATWTQFYGFVNVIQSKIYKFEYKDNYNVWLRLKAAENKIPSQVKKINIMVLYVRFKLSKKKLKQDLRRTIGQKNRLRI